MRVRFGSALAVVLAVAAGSPAEDAPVDAKLLVGKWAPPNQKTGEKVVLGFAAGGKLTVSTTIDNKTETMTGTYKLVGNKLMVAMKIKDKDVTHDVRILRLTDAEMDTADADGKKETLRRLAGG